MKSMTFEALSRVEGAVLIFLLEVDCYLIFLMPLSMIVDCLLLLSLPSKEVIKAFMQRA